MSKYIKFFNELSKKDTAIAGGKGASLGEMAGKGFPVPPGFVVLAAAFDRFLKETDLVAEVEAQLKKVNPEETHTIDDASETLRQLINKYEMPKDLEKEILTAFDGHFHTSKYRSEEGVYVAVRSSATAEDSQVASWAGELESYLGIQKIGLLAAVKQCWSSLFTPRAIFYRIEKKLGGEKVSVAVVVQKMVESEVAGVCFTAHPVTCDRNQMVIEASWGLGESVVAGKVTPDTYIVDKTKLSVVDININEQLTQITRKGQITKERPVPKSRAAKQCLSNDKIIELARIAKQIENLYHFPCDIEWAIENNKIYIVQSRPITTL